MANWIQSHHSRTMLDWMRRQGEINTSTQTKGWVHLIWSQINFQENIQHMNYYAREFYALCNLLVASSEIFLFVLLFTRLHYFTYSITSLLCFCSLSGALVRPILHSFSLLLASIFLITKYQESNDINAYHKHNTFINITGDLWVCVKNNMVRDFVTFIGYS